MKNIYWCVIPGCSGLCNSCHQHCSKYCLSIILLAHERCYKWNAFVWIAAVMRQKLKKIKHCLVWEVKKKIVVNQLISLSWSFIGLILESNVSLYNNKQHFKQAIKLSGVVLSSESVVIWSLLLCNFRSRKPSLFYGIPVLPALYDLLDDLWMYLLWVNMWVWLFLIACKYFVYLLVWIFTDFSLIWVLDIFNLDLNCILLIDYIGYFKLEDLCFFLS